MATEEPRRTSRVRKTPSKLVRDYEVLETSPRFPSLVTWDEDGLRQFYDGVVQHGAPNLAKISSICGRTLTTCEGLYNQHKGFLSSIVPETSAMMWQYFLSGAADCLQSSEEQPAVGRGPNTSAQAGPSGRASTLGPAAASAQKRAPGRRSKAFDEDVTPNGHRRGGGSVTPKQLARDHLADRLTSPRTTPGGRSRKRKLDFAGVDDSPSLANNSYASKLDMLAAAASEAAGKPQTPATSNENSQEAQPSQMHAASDPAYDAKRTPTKRNRVDSDLMSFSSPGLRPPQFLSPSAHRRGVLSPSARSLGLASPQQLGVDDLHHGAMAVDLQGMDHGQEGFYEGFLLRGQAGLDEVPGNLSDLGSPFGTPNSHLQGCRGLLPSPMKSPHGAMLDGGLTAVALRPSAQAALQGLSVERMGHGFENATSQPPNPGSQRRGHPRKSAPERLSIGLVQHRGWLMRGCEGNVRAPTNGASPITGDTDQPMSALEQKLRHCLNLRTRRWATYEFMLSAIDEPWFQDGTMQQLLTQLGLGGIKAFSRADLSFIRSALGAPPRRLSHVFLHSERCALHAHRVRCRAFYEQHVHQEHLPHPKGVPAQCRVGQTVTARHPKLRTIHDGDVLTAGVNTYMVQFHRPDLGVAKVPDTDIAHAQARPLGSGEADSVGAADGTSSRGGTAPAAQVRETDAADLDLMTQVTHLLGEKQKVLAELRSMNIEAQRRRSNGDLEQFDEAFQNEFAIKVLEVKKLNTELDSSCPALRSRVDDLDRSNTLVTRAAPVGAALPSSADEGTSSVAGSIVEESVAEAAALVHHLFEKQVAASGMASDAASAKPSAELAATAGEGQEDAEAQAGGAASKMALFVDDEILMQMSTKLTAMFIAIQRCAAGNPEPRTVQQAMIKLVDELKPASQESSQQYQLITKNVGRLSSHLGAR